MNCTNMLMLFVMDWINILDDAAKGCAGDANKHGHSQDSDSIPVTKTRARNIYPLSSSQVEAFVQGGDLN